MYVVMIAPECAPVVQVGGLADVVPGLSRELEIRGHAVEVILPKYDHTGQGVWVDYGLEICRRANEILAHDF